MKQAVRVPLNIMTNVLGTNVIKEGTSTYLTVLGFTSKASIIKFDAQSLKPVSECEEYPEVSLPELKS